MRVQNTKDGRAMIKNDRGMIVWSGPKEKSKSVLAKIKKQERERIAERLARPAFKPRSVRDLLKYGFENFGLPRA